MAQDNGRRPNILVITDDQHNPTCFGYAGHPVVRTPNIDALVASGTNFSRAYVAHPLCTPSRASLFTGLTTRGHRVRMNGIQLRTDVPTWPEALSQQGYTTHYSGKPHLRISRASKGTPIDQVDPNEFSESRELWHSGRIREAPDALLRLPDRRFRQRPRPRLVGAVRQLAERGAPEGGRPVPQRDSAGAAQPRLEVLLFLVQVGASRGAAPHKLDNGPRHRLPERRRPNQPAGGGRPPGAVRALDVVPGPPRAPGAPCAVVL